MLGTFGVTEFASTWYIGQRPSFERNIAVLNDTSNHGGLIVTTNQDGTLLLNGEEVALEGALHSCPIPGHGVTLITAVTTRTYHNGKLILTEEAVAGCGAKIISQDRGVQVE